MHDQYDWALQFPWVLKDYTSSKLKLEDESVFRDFSRPVGIQNRALEANIRQRYEEFDDPSLGKFHFGSHYSNAASVMHYLVRLEPFTSLHIELQSGRYSYWARAGLARAGLGLGLGLPC